MSEITLFHTYVGGPNEDDGYVLVQTIDARAKKASISILNAKDMSLVYRGLAPELGLFGLHTRFFSFDDGCSTDDCVPKDSTTSTKSSTTVPTDSTTSINAVHDVNIINIINNVNINVNNVNVNMQ